VEQREWRHLLARVVADVSGTPASGGVGGRERCACHGVLAAGCPARVSPLVRAGASRLGLHASGPVPGSVAGLIDHTLLNADATRTQIAELCDQAGRFRFATVCVNPVWVPTAVRLLRGSGVGVCGVVGFPLGATLADVKAYEARRIIAEGAVEVDVVINLGALKSADLGLVEHDLRSVTDPCRTHGVTSKVIIEAALLSDAEKVAACVLAKLAGADYVKTSTGFGPGGATVADVALMRRVVGPEMGVKAAGGIRDLAAVRALVGAGAERIGASAGVAIMREVEQERVERATGIEPV
jgi:deoxyribose-phosphate aldolase